MKHKSFFLSLGVLIFLFPAICFASPVITSVYDPVNGAEMGLVKVTATYADNSVQFAYWEDMNLTDPNNTDGQARKDAPDGFPYFILSNGGDTYSTEWTIQNFYSSPITSLEILGYYVNEQEQPVFTGIVFDILSNLDEPPSTPGSERGRLLIDGYSYELIDPIYYLQGLTPTKTDDLYAGIRINLGALTQGASLNFSLDSDMATAVPIPSAYLLLGSGLLGLIGLKRRAR